MDAPQETFFWPPEFTREDEDFEEDEVEEEEEEEEESVDVSVISDGCVC